MELLDFNLQLVTLGPPCTCLSFLINNFPLGSSWPQLTYWETEAQLPHVECIPHQPLVNWHNWLEYPHVFIGNTSLIFFNPGPFCSQLFVIWVLLKHYNGQWYKSFHLLISHLYLLLHENWFLFEAMSLTASHCAFAKSMWRHENSSKNIRSPPHHRSSSKMFVSFNKTYPLKQMNICPRPWNSGALFERKILFQPTRHFSGRNPPAWWSRGTPRQSRRSLQFNSVVWCLVVWGPGGFGIQSGYLLYVLLIFIHFIKGSLRNPNHWAPNHQ